jgi:hypothetical protein
MLPHCDEVRQAPKRAINGRNRVSMRNNERQLHSKIQAGVSADVQRQLKEIAADRLMPTSAAIREAMREYLARSDPASLTSAERVSIRRV